MCDLRNWLCEDTEVRRVDLILIAAAALLAALVLVLGLSTPAGADERPCATPRAELLDTLKLGRGQEPIGRGLTSSGTVLELLTARDGSWSVVTTGPGGRGCVRAAGTAWDWGLARAQPAPPEPPRDASTRDEVSR